MPAGRQLQPLPPHGTRARYGSRQDPCTCSACRGANNRYMAGYRAQAARPVDATPRGVPGQMPLPGTVSVRR